MSVDDQAYSPLRLKMVRRQHKDRRAKGDGDGGSDDGGKSSGKSGKSRSSKDDSSGGSSSKSSKSKAKDKSSSKQSSSSTSSSKKSKSTSSNSSGGLPPVTAKGGASSTAANAAGLSALSATTAPLSGQTNQANAISGQSTSSMNSNAQVAIIVGAVLGSLAVIAAMVLFFLLCRWRRKDRETSGSNVQSISSRTALPGSIDPYAVPPSASQTQQPFQPAAAAAAAAAAAYPEPVYDPRDSRSIYDDRHIDVYEEKAPSDSFYDDYYTGNHHDTNGHQSSSYPDYQRRAGHDSIY